MGSYHAVPADTMGRVVVARTGWGVGGSVHSDFHGCRPLTLGRRVSRRTPGPCPCTSEQRLRRGHTREVGCVRCPGRRHTEGDHTHRRSNSVMSPVCLSSVFLVRVAPSTLLLQLACCPPGAHTLSPHSLPLSPPLVPHRQEARSITETAASTDLKSTVFFLFLLNRSGAVAPGNEHQSKTAQGWPRRRHHR